MQIFQEMTHVKTGKAGNPTAKKKIFKHQVGDAVLITDYI